MATLVTVVTNRLAAEESRLSLEKQGIDRAIELSDLYSNVKPEAYILPLTLLSGEIASQIRPSRRSRDL